MGVIKRMMREMEKHVHDRAPIRTTGPSERGKYRCRRAAQTSRRGHLIPLTCRAILLGGFLVAATCGWAHAFGLRAAAERPVMLRPVEVLTRSALSQYAGATVGLARFQGPPGHDAEMDAIARAYLKALLKLGAFKEVKTIARPVRDDSEAVWLSRREGCDLILTATVRHVVGGTGAMPTHLQVDVRILDARMNGVAWHLQQRGRSEPGKDLDLFWSTRVGAPAQKVPVLAEALAEQLSRYLADPSSNP